MMASVAPCFSVFVYSWLIGWAVDFMVGWFVRWLVNGLVGWFVDWSVDWAVDLFDGGLIVRRLDNRSVGLSAG